jgi:hypothetical protein
MSRLEYVCRIYVCYYPVILVLIFLAAVVWTPVPAKGNFLARALVALFIATFLAHVNRIFGLWPAHLLFPSGHTTFCAGLTWSLAMLRPWTLVLSVPLLIYLAFSLVEAHLHETMDVIGAFPLVLAIYGPIHAWWRLPGDSASLDTPTLSP